MKKALPIKDNEKGSIMVMALLIMATLAIAGALVSKDALIESQAARNYAFRQQTLYAAQSAALELIAQENLANYNNIVAQPWGYIPEDQGGSFPKIEDFNASDWGTTYPARQSSLKNANTDFDYISSASAIAVYTGTVNSAAMNLGLGGTGQIYSYTIYGRAVHGGVGNNSVIIVIGYRTPV